MDMLNKKMIMTESNIVQRGRLKELDRGRPKKTWWDCVKNDMESLGLSQQDVQSRNRWRRRIKEATTIFPGSPGKMAVKTECVCVCGVVPVLSVYPCKDGQAESSWTAGYITRWSTCTKIVKHPAGFKSDFHPDKAITKQCTTVVPRSFCLLKAHRR